MAEIDLKAYTARVVELEAAIYTQKKLMVGHENAIQSQRPARPVLKEIERPTIPNKPIPQEYHSGCAGGLIYFFLILGILSLILSFLDGDVLLFFTGLLFGGFGVKGVLAIAKGKRTLEEKNQLDSEDYHHKVKEYDQQMEKYNHNIAAAKQAYSDACAQYAIDIETYDTGSKVVMDQHASTLADLEQALKAVYEENVVFEKYRNLVAITAINEYLRSGRCSELEGPNGAYNLYEMELRQNIIIGQLSSIIDNLEQIRNNQYTLYKELTKANATVDDILRSVRGVEENTKLTTYFAEVNALVAAAPRVTVGRIF